MAQHPYSPGFSFGNIMAGVGVVGGVETVPLAAPVDIHGADIRWLLNWQSPVQLGG